MQNICNPPITSFIQFGKLLQPVKRMITIMVEIMLIEKNIWLPMELVDNRFNSL